MDDVSIPKLWMGYVSKRLLLQLFYMPRTIAIEQDSRIYSICIDLLKQASTDLSAIAIASTIPDLLKEVRLFIRQQVRQGKVPEIYMIAKDFGIPSSSLWRYHKELYNISLYQFIHQERLAYAYTLITETELTIKEIAFKLGFNDTAGFSRTFKKLYGYSPIHFRNT